LSKDKISISLIALLLSFSSAFDKSTSFQTTRLLSYTASKKECKGWVTHSQIQVIPGVSNHWGVNEGNTVTVGFLRQWEDKGTFWSLILPRTSFRCFQKHNTAVSTFTINYSISLEEIIPRADTVKTYTNVGIKYSPIQSRNLSLY
jgi:hypothetical protein